MKLSNKKLFFTLFLIGVLVHGYYYYSANLSHTLDIFFDHVTAGQDFFQVPNGAYAWLKGGSLVGIMPPGASRYTDCCGVNNNVYHPLFTLLVGIPLQLFSPSGAFNLWMGVHLLVTAASVWFLYQKFQSHKFIWIALAIFLFNSYHYYEIWHNQYQFLFNFFSLIFLVKSLRDGDNPSNGFWLFLSLLVKPIGLLWIVPLLIAGYRKTVLTGLGTYLLITLPFWVIPWGKYYLTNLIPAINANYPSYNLLALTRLTALSLGVFFWLKIAVAVGLIIYQIIRRPPLFTVIALWISYQLLFYSGVYHYYYTITASLLALSLLLNILRFSKSTVLATVLLTLPALPALMFHLGGAPEILPQQSYYLTAIWSATCLIFYDLLLILKSPPLVRLGSKS